MMTSHDDTLGRLPAAPGRPQGRIEGLLLQGDCIHFINICVINRRP